MSKTQEKTEQEKSIFVVPEEEALPGALSDIQKVVLSLVLLVAIAGFGFRIFFRGSIKLVTPGKLSALAAKDLSFSWRCNKPGISFVLEVYDESEMIMRQLTNEESYTPDTDQKLEFQANHSYRWRVIPNPDLKQRYNLDTEFQVFYITKALPPPPAPEQPEIVQPDATTPEQQSSPEQTDKSPTKKKPNFSDWPRD
jgi:hypothetical protein